MIINTTKGPVDESLMEKREGVDQAPAVPFGIPVRWVEYWLNGELVHRSAQGIVGG